MESLQANTPHHNARFVQDKARGMGGPNDTSHMQLQTSNVFFLPTQRPSKVSGILQEWKIHMQLVFESTIIFKSLIAFYLNFFILFILIYPQSFQPKLAVH